MQTKVSTNELTIRISNQHYNMLIKIMRALGHKDIDHSIEECIFSFWAELESIGIEENDQDD